MLEGARSGLSVFFETASAGRVSSQIVDMTDLFPTLAAAAGEPDVVAKLKDGATSGGRTYKLHLDSRMSPCASAESARQIGFKQDRNAAGQANLPAMRVSAQHQIEAGVRRLPVDFRSVREQDRNATMRDLRRRFFDVVGPVEMRVVDPREINRSRPALDGDAFVEQHADAERLQVGNHGDRIVVAEHRIDIAAQRFA